MNYHSSNTPYNMKMIHRPPSSTQLTAHQPRFIPDDLRLTLLRCDRVDFRSGFPVAEQKIIPDRRRKQRFSVLLCDDQQGFPILPG